jgi:CelD/BcsL family acetyltransferase involved in cellulose biosynthesis
VLFLKMIEDLCRAGVKELDYGPGAAAYKERFGDHCQREALLSIYAPTAKGLLVNVLTTCNAWCNRLARALARRCNIADFVKRHWRNQIASRSGKKNASAKSNLSASPATATQSGNALVP